MVGTANSPKPDSQPSTVPSVGAAAAGFLHAARSLGEHNRRKAQEKVAVSKGRMRVAQTRSGRRSMSVETMLKKDKAGELYKTSDGARGSTKLGRVMAKLALSPMAPPTPLTKTTQPAVGQMKQPGQGGTVGSVGVPGVPTSSVPGLPGATQQASMPKVGSLEDKMPWYTTAVGGASGALLGQRLLPKYKTVGTLAGTLLGTGVGLEGGGALAKKVDAKKAQELVAARKKLPGAAASYIRDALREGVLEKSAEPPPPEGVSVEQWDHLLSKGSDQGTTQPIAVPQKRPRKGDVPTREDDFLGTEREELPTLAIAKFGAAADEFCKLNAVTRDEAVRSLERLQQLKKQPMGELARGAAVGAIAAPILGLASRKIRGGEPIVKGLKALVSTGGRNLAADSVTGATYGGAVPAARNLLERKVEREKLEDFVAGGKRRGLRRTVARSMGV